MPALYTLPSADFHDITTGSSSGSPVYNAGPGYDLVTGRGTPYADLVVRDLVGRSSGPVGPAPTISSIVVAEATLRDGVLSPNESGVVTWAETSSSAVTSATLLIDGNAVSAVYGPYGPYSGSYYYAGVFSPLTAGTHNYTIQVTDSDFQTTTATGSFVVATVGPAISLVVVAEATYQNGVLNAGEQGVITWAATSSNTIINRSLTVDNKPATANYGPYGPYSGSYYFAGVFGSVSTGTHNFTVRVTDNKGVTNTLSGSFAVSKVGGNSVVAVASEISLTSEQVASMMADAGRQLSACSSAGVWADGNGLTPHSGNWSYDMLSGSDTVGPADRAISAEHVDLLTALAYGLSQVLDEGQSDSHGPMSSSVPVGAHPLFGEEALLPMPARIRVPRRISRSTRRRLTWCSLRPPSRRPKRSWRRPDRRASARVAPFDVCACQGVAWLFLSSAHFTQVATRSPAIRQRFAILPKPPRTLTRSVRSTMPIRRVARLDSDWIRANNL